SALYYVFTAINLCVTVFFRASVGAQRGAYATSVLAMMTGAAAAAYLNRYKGRTGHLLLRTPWYFLGCGVVFALAMMESILSSPAGLRIAFWFILAILVTSLVSRYLRTMELRFKGFHFVDAESRFLWESLVAMDFPVLVPHRPGRRTIEEKEQE